MATSLLRNRGSDLYVCARCEFKASRISNNATRRWIGTKWLAKQATYQIEWTKQAQEVKDGKKKSMLTILEERGLVQQLTGDRDSFDKMLTENRVGAYVGIDPTASSLHLGHLLPLMPLFWMYYHGYHAVTLLGGATAKIGDPTDRLVTREKLDSATRNENMYKMHYQLKTLWSNVEVCGRKHGYKWEPSWKRGLLNNFAWMNKLSIMEFLQVLGLGSRIGAMLAKDTVKKKMQKGDGVSFAEFTYPLLQAWDWWHMYAALRISMQIGGSDQYGNITAGVDAVKYIKANHPDKDQVREPLKNVPAPIGMTVPLLTSSSGEKFGKSTGNALWLDKDLMTSFDLYGYFLRTSDADVEKYLKWFTFLPIEEIGKIVEEHMVNPSQRKAQHTLARNALELIHGEAFARGAEAQHRLLFKKPDDPEAAFLRMEVEKANESSPDINAINRPKADVKLPRSFVLTASIGRIVYASGLARSATEGHHLVSQNAIYVGGSPNGFKKTMADDSMTFTTVKLWTKEKTHEFLKDERLLVLRRGKSNIRIIHVVPDEQFEKTALQFPGIESFDFTKARTMLDGPAASEFQWINGEYVDVGPEAKLKGAQLDRAKVKKLRKIRKLERDLGYDELYDRSGSRQVPLDDKWDWEDKNK